MREPGTQYFEGTNEIPAEWLTSSYSMTEVQEYQLRMLTEQTGEPFDESLSRAAAAQRIQELQQQLGIILVDIE